MRVIFVCTHNSARSQMAEGLLRAMAPERCEVHSAGSQATRVRAEAVTVMRELGIDISGHESKTLERYLDQPFDLLVTVCDSAREACPTLPGVRRQEHWSIADPAAVTGEPEARLAAFRAARDEIADRLRASGLVVGT